MSPLMTILSYALIILAAGLIQGLTGFGFGLIAVPMLLLFLPPKTVVPVVTVLGLLITTIMLVKLKYRVEWKRIRFLAIAGIIGMPLGTYLLVAVSGDMLKVAIGIVVASFGVLSLAGFRREIKSEGIASALVGFASGVIKGSTSMPGPPAVLFLANQDCKKHAFQANLVAYFTILGLATLPFFIACNLMTRQVLLYSALFLPVTFLGAMGGMRLTACIKEGPFRIVTLGLTVVAGLMSVISVLALCF